ncbi:Dual specificity protein kinase [Nymphaea thermarum]|nr:Dual specificity protein kinase [Nymphaea thermarum]
MSARARSRWELKSRDLGCALQTGVAAEAGGLAGTPLFNAPEVARGQRQGSAADVWALGCTVVEMATGRPPWAGDVTDPVSALYRIGYTDAVPEMPENLSEEGRDFLGRCFCRNPSERSTAEELLEHSFVNKSNSFEVEGKPFSDSPKSILDRDLWDSVGDRSTQTGTQSSGSSPVLAPAPSAANRIRALLSPAARKPEWSWGETWVPVRANAPENSPSPSISGAQDSSEPAIESITSEKVNECPIEVENSAALNGGIEKEEQIEEEIDCQSQISRMSCPINSIDLVINQIADKYSIQTICSLSLCVCE